MTLPTEPTTSPTATQSGDHVKHLAAKRTAAVAAVFSIVVAALLAYDYSRRRAGDPTEATAVVALKKALAEQPQNEILKQQYRAVELQERSEYSRQRRFTAVGALLLSGGVLVFLIAVMWADALRPRLPLPKPAPSGDPELQWTQMARWGVAAVAMLLVVGAVGLSLGMRSDLPRSEDELAAISSPNGGDNEVDQPSTVPLTPTTSPEKPVQKVLPEANPFEPTGKPSTAEPHPTAMASAKTVAEPPVKAKAASVEPLPSDEEAAKMWPRFRGPDGLGISAYTNIPTEWNVPEGKGVRWKTRVPLDGFSSPVVWGKLVFLTGADEKTRRVYCFDADSGKVLWEKDVPGTPQSTAEPAKTTKDTGFAAPTPATDGRRVYAIFANGDLAAMDFAGSVLWSKSLGLPENSYGHAASLLTYQNLLIVPFDQGSASAGKSRLFAMDSATGNTVWEAKRQVPNSWTTPIVIQHAGRSQLITSADPWVTAYDLLKGTELWKAKCMRQDVGPSPVFAEGMVYAVTEYTYLVAIRADGNGDVTASHIAWKGEDGLPDTCSPLATKDHVYVLATHGTLTCYDAKEGAMKWEEDLETEFYGSPSLVGNRIYVFNKEGKAWVVEAGPEKCKRISQCEMGEPCVTSPAFQDGCFFIRTEKHLLCIGNK